MTTLLERAGGEKALLNVLRTFYNDVFTDPMIGFHFARTQKSRLIEKELELLRIALGADEAVYTGMPLDTAHRKHKITGGHFERRVVLLKAAMRRHHLCDEAQAAILTHNESLRAMITADSGSDCHSDGA